MPNHISHITMKYDEPLKMDLEDVAFKDISILVGKNASGKTLILKHAFMATTLMHHIVLGDDPVEAAQFIVSHSLDTPASFTGQFGAEMTGGEGIRVVIEEGIVKGVDYKNLNKGEESTVQPIRYMSSGMRLFSDIQQYLAIRDLVDKDMTKVLQHFKLYDMTYIEGLIASCPIEYPDVIEAYEFTDLPKTLEFNEKLNEFFVKTESGEVKPAVSFSAGHQAILNMFSGMQ